jgi:hypothetical protein
LLLTCHRERALKILFGFRRIRLGQLKRDLASNAINYGFPPAFPWWFVRPSSFRRCDAMRPPFITA